MRRRVKAQIFKDTWIIFICRNKSAVSHNNLMWLRKDQVSSFMNRPELQIFLLSFLPVFGIHGHVDMLLLVRNKHTRICQSKYNPGRTSSDENRMRASLKHYGWILARNGI